MLALDLLKAPSELVLKPVYVLFGDDSFLLRESLEAVRKLVLPGMDDETSITRFTGDSAKLASVLDELHTLPFFAKHRLVVVEGADKFITAHRKELEEYVEHPASRGTLLLSAKLWTSTTKLAKLVEKLGISVDCRSPNEKSISPLLIQIAKTRSRVVLERDASSLLLELVGPEIGLLAAEIEKLAVYVGTRAKIRREDVAKIVGAGRVETAWKMIECATTGRGALALEQLEALITAGENEVALLAQFSFSLRKVHHAGRLRRLKLEHAEACRIAGITYPAAIDLARRQHAHLGPTRVDQLPALLLRADLDLKGGSQLAPRVVLERLIVRLAGPRHD